MSSGTKRAVRADIDTGNAVGVDGTPSIYVNGRKFPGLVIDRGFPSIHGTRSSESRGSSKLEESGNPQHVRSRADILGLFGANLETNSDASVIY